MGQVSRVKTIIEVRLPPLNLRAMSRGGFPTIQIITKNPGT